MRHIDRLRASLIEAKGVAYRMRLQDVEAAVENCLNILEDEMQRRRIESDQSLHEKARQKEVG